MSARDNIHRTVLPIPHQAYVDLTTYDAKDPDTTYPPILQLRPPAGAPNVLVVLLDDVGSGGSSAFGGPCQTPNCEKLAANGLSYTRFHTTPLCSPTRQALLTGRNHHSGCRWSTSVRAQFDRLSRRFLAGERKGRIPLAPLISASAKTARAAASQVAGRGAFFHT
jgi:hypothetical protein